MKIGSKPVSEEEVRWMLERFAKAMEAQRAETGTGSVHDSAARRDRPTPASEKQSND